MKRLAIIICMSLLSVMITFSYGLPASIQTISFHAQGSKAEFTIDLPRANMPYTIKPKGLGIQIDISGGELAEKWQHTMDLRYLHSCVLSIEGKSKAEFIINLKPGCQFSHSQLNNRVLVKIFPGTNPVAVLTINFQSIPVRALLQVLAESAHINIISSDEVSGKMSIHLEKVSWKQAFTIILQTQNLAARQVNGAWYVAPQASILAQEKLQTEIAAQEQVGQPLQTQYFHLHYSDTKSLAYTLKQNFPGISVSLDARSNMLIIKATTMQLAQITQLIRRVDIPMRQVLIEARIAVIDRSAMQQLGVIMGNGSDALLQRLPGINGAKIDLPVDNPAGSIGIHIGHWPDGSSIDLELQALEAQGQGEIISSPKLLVSDNQQASIEQGNEIPFQTSTSSGATQIEFKKAVLGLEVTPHISSDNQVLLDLQVNDDAIVNNETTAGQTPIIATSKLRTKVLVANGKTVVLGGIHIAETRHDRRGIPYLDAMPGVGWLFRHSTDVSRKTELVVFITPKITR
ncbi:MAG: type IV pilus secretin PilQ [Gammaproteobacteria bacterium]|nr:type IV pilus secretin PilQ [Gammaproteobacteria bacterium]